MKYYYRVKIEDVFDLMRQINFLEVLYPDIYKLVEQRNSFINIYDNFDKRVVKNDLKFLRALKKRDLPRYLIFVGDDEEKNVEELFSKKEVCLSKELLNQCRIISGLGKYLNEYSPEELIHIYDNFPKVFQDKNKTDIVSFSDFHRKS